MEEIFVSLEMDCQKLTEVEYDGGKNIYRY